MTNQTLINKNLPNKKLIVERAFDGTLDVVWEAWTEAEILDKWWAPKPYRAQTKKMDFTVGGMWLYAMISLEDEKHWCRVDFRTVAPKTNFSSTAGFCDEEGNPNDIAPLMHWNNTFRESGDGTNVSIEISFDKIEDLETIVGMGFEEGFTMGLSNLDEYLATLK